MTLVLRPPGRGAWTPLLLRIEHSKHAPLPLEVHAGQRVTIAGRVFRRNASIKASWDRRKSTKVMP